MTEPRRSLWLIIAVLVLLPVLYVASVGPVYRWGFPDHFVGAVPEQPLGGAVEHRDRAAVVDHDHGIDSCIQQRLTCG